MGAPAARVSELAGHWSRDGNQVAVLTGFPNHPTGTIPKEYRSKLWRLVMKERLESVDVVRSWLFPFPNRKAYERVLNYSSFCISAATTGMFLARPDIVIATSPQLLVGLAGWWLSRMKRVPFIFEVRDLWPESLAAVGMGAPGSILHRTLSPIAGFLYRNSDHIVVVTAAFKDFLIANWNVPASKISIVENGVECDLFRPMKVHPLRRQLAAEDKFVVSYIGTMGMAHGLETVIEAAREVQATAPDVLFLLVGEGADKERIVNLARKHEVANLRFVSGQSRDKVPEFISASDACVVSLKKSELFKTVIPTKMLEFMSCARPVLLGVDGQARQILEDARAGIYFEPENPVALAKAIIRLAGDRQMCEVLGQNGRRHILANLSRRQTAQNYLSVLNQVLGTAQKGVSAAD
jgi:glycosyltransferase involved in cell wall biosynthesis